IGAMAVRPASRPSQSARTPTPSGETAPQPVITAARLDTDATDYFTPAAPGSTRSASAERALLDRARVGGGVVVGRHAHEGDRILPLQHPGRDHVGTAHRGDPD